ncbi:hypothetical protein SAMN05444422_1217 [Halobiforma haloterrestris]|uniref:Uncharacterized protein n=1 Tax=Natronobacterium haloterrestre TaxID=148448 RepID=A0A1I1LQF9_NATHA|nr:hypothetical protein SAMN05444422_1217 [Halobiforma haloterrestris]
MTSQVASIAFDDAITHVTADNVDAFGTQLLKTLAREYKSEIDPIFRWEQTVAETIEVLERLPGKSSWRTTFESL